jgi:hypothetical protein
VRHVTMLKLLYQWRVRVLVPKRFEKAIPVFRDSAHEELATALHPSDGDELGLTAPRPSAADLSIT